ncbi:MAG: tRNA (adenosine(37)-N6)-threonylcarbamoyltransferase complex dimerization subunit type 1 TsaB [bacterium]
MLNTLCIETSGPHCSLALAAGGHIYRRDEWLQRSHNQHLLPLLDELFKQAAIRPTELELVSFGCGPGSFTGVRIAAAAAQAIATASGARVVPLSSAWVLAATACLQHPQLEQLICCIASRGEAYYVSAYECHARRGAEQAHITQRRADELVDQPPAWLSEAHVKPGAEQGIALVGKVPGWLPAAWHDHVLDVIHPQAGVMLHAAQAQHLAGASLPAAHGLPRYFAGDSPWQKTHERGIATG